MNALTMRGEDGSNNDSRAINDGRPIVPDFTDIIGALPEEMHDDWICNLATENFDRISEAMELGQIFITPSSVEYIFTVCVRLRLPQEVKYTAALIFNDFMLVHVDDLHQVVYASSESNDAKRTKWEQVEASMSRQTTLRILSAIQIASKLHNYHDSLSRHTVMICLRNLGYAYTEGTVMRSEIRMLNSLGWKFSGRHTPLIYAESLLKALEIRMPKTFNTGTYWQFTLLTMDIVFLNWAEILGRMLVNVLGSAGTNLPRSYMCRVWADWMLLGAGVVAAAATCADGVCMADRVIEQLHTIIGTPQNDITDMCVAIVEFGMAKNVELKK